MMLAIVGGPEFGHDGGTNSDPLFRRPEGTRPPGTFPHEDPRPPGAFPHEDPRPWLEAHPKSVRDKPRIN